MESNKKQDQRQAFLEQTKCLSDNQFRYLFITLLEEDYRHFMTIQSDLFNHGLTEEKKKYKITEDIVTAIGGIEEIEKGCESLFDRYLTPDMIREILKIEPFEFQEKTITVKRNML